MNVVIVGAGPAGAALGYLLSRRGVTVRLLERHVDLEREFRGEALQTSGIAALEQMGLSSRLAALPQVQIRAAEIRRGRRIAAILDFDALGFAGPRITPQPPLLQQILEASRGDRFTFDAGMTVRDLVVEDERVAGVRAQGPDKSEQLIRADYVIGADGRTSVLRKRAGLEVIASETVQSFDVLWLKVPRPPTYAQGIARVTFRDNHAAISYSAPGDRVQLGVVLDKGGFAKLKHDAWRLFVVEAVDEDLRPAVAQVEKPVILDVQCYRIANWWRPGLLLLGDAAHPMSPIGGQGINIALRDAIVAANHLIAAGITAGIASGSGLEALDQAARAIQREREPEIAAIQRAQAEDAQTLLGGGWLGRVAIALLPIASRLGLLRVISSRYRRYAQGITEVALRV